MVVRLPSISTWISNWISQLILHCGCRRQGKGEVGVRVEIEAEGEKEHHELAKPLAELLGMKHESRANVLQALFTYIHLHKLQVGPLLNPCSLDSPHPVKKIGLDRASGHRACTVSWREL